MSKRAFGKIKTGLEDAIAITRDEADPATYRVHVPAEAEVRLLLRDAVGGSRTSLRES